jgi:hypothetical protein
LLNLSRDDPRPDGPGRGSGAGRVRGVGCARSANGWTAAPWRARCRRCGRAFSACRSRRSGVDFLIEKNFNADFGARPLKRAIERAIEDPMSEEILRGALSGHWLLKVRVEDGKIAFHKEQLPEPTPPEPAVAASNAATPGDAPKS